MVLVNELSKSSTADDERSPVEPAESPKVCRVNIHTLPILITATERV